MGYKGLPLATAISISISFLLIWNLLIKKLPELESGNLLLTFSKAMLMCFVEGLIVYLASHLVFTKEKLGLIMELSLLAITGVLGFLFYFFVGYLLKYPNFERIVKQLKV
jgi:peptidoglycan biosynthesis protein MviN/MurJ (putative lipid II flippase)